ncbi:MAG: His/Gly/Thr/Pro-type tRNA ligase C-terminal domain-containing protein [Candidatus Sungbacteria bacterium]|nr:His/Gly/Thr/Pro-type tRNA ligase C-terminal domain-containing protein [bacterium]MDZ4260250.1 His/Gly/Thr/Pro-type tRNA ligase C-terminal domain-containing protein [Candidatus Sungbacteria bacterium]
MPKTKTSPTESFFHHLDRLPEKEGAFELLRDSFRNIALFYGFDKISFSAIDDARVYAPLIKAGLLAERPPVILKAAAGPDIVVRMSACLSVLRAYKSHKMNDFAQPVKVFLEGESFSFSLRQDIPMSRRDEETLVMAGEEGPIAEAQIVQVIWNSLIDMGVPVKNLGLVVNAIGCNQCYTHFRSSLSSHLRNKVAGLCKNCKRSFKTTPTKILVCEEEKCSIATSHAPQMLDNLCEHCKKHLRGFLEFLDEMGIPYHLDLRRFRTGFWADTILFEFTYTTVRPAVSVPTEKISDDSVQGDAVLPVQEEEPASLPVPVPPAIKRGFILAEGGRSTRAAELMGCKGLEIAAGTLFLDAVSQVTFPPRTVETRPDVYLAQLGEIARRRSMRVLEMLRVAGISVKESLGRDAIKSQLKLAEKFGAPVSLILGQKEVIDQTIIVRETDSGIQEIVPQEKLIDFLRRRLKKEVTEV